MSLSGYGRLMARSPAFPVLFVAMTSLGATGCAPAKEGPLTALGTPALREALFDTILAKTKRREAFSTPKQQALGVDPLTEMERLRRDLVEAETEDELFYALLRISNARRDRHLSMGLVPGGVRPSLSDGIPNWGAAPSTTPKEAPIRILPDYGVDSDGYFIADVARELAPESLSPGDRILTVNGLTAQELEHTLRPYIRHSSEAGFRWKLAEALSQRTGVLPPSFRGQDLSVEVEKQDGTRVSERLPYLNAEAFEWEGASDPKYHGFRMEWSTPTFDLFLPTAEVGALVLAWHRFSATLMTDVDRLMAFAARERLLDYAVIVDATRSGGGSLGPYAVQHLQPKAFKTTFGNLRLSDIIEPFVQDRREAFRAGRVYDDAGKETVDDGTWLLDWLENDVLEALNRGDSLSASVPFKLAHAPKDSDGILQPAPTHFRGPLVVFSGPHGGSHLDQFISIVADNGLGHLIGMPAGGYSNTWEWEETLSYPTTEQRVIGMMWSIGHTIRPNGEILEGNPAPVYDWVPLTAENSTRYSEILLQRAYSHLESIGRLSRGQRPDPVGGEGPSPRPGTVGRGNP